MNYKVGKIISEIHDRFGILITPDLIRRYEKMGLFKLQREGKGDYGYRITDLTMLEEVINIIILAKSGLSKQAIKTHDADAFARHITSMRKVLNVVRKPLNWS